MIYELLHDYRHSLPYIIYIIKGIYKFKLRDYHLDKIKIAHNLIVKSRNIPGGTLRSEHFVENSIMLGALPVKVRRFFDRTNVCKNFASTNCIQFD